MRVIAGKYRGRTLCVFRGQDIRPTPDRVKESLFQIIGPALIGAHVLDLFCGSGALGIECLSRGAEEVVFNDGAKESCELTKKNLALVGEKRIVHRQGFKDCLLSLPQRFDFIFCDPPYAENYLCDIAALVKKRGLLSENGCIVYESEREEEVPEGFLLSDKRSYGRVKIYFFREERS